MTREEARKAAEVMLAYADGKEIECLCDGGWSSAFFPTFDWYGEEYRIKPKHPKFDTKTLKPFDRVLVRDGDEDLWTCVLFSHYTAEVYPFICGNASYMYCIPYNDDTKHLVGTCKEAPEHYRYWEEQVVGIEEEKTEKHPNNVWHDVNEEPKEYPIICQDELSNVWIQYSLKDYVDGWKEFKECKCITRWAYAKGMFWQSR